jgi:maltose O-acetyltransferase
MTGRSEREKMLAGELYRAVGPEIEADQRRAHQLLHAYNLSSPGQAAPRAAILRELLGAVAEDVVIRPPFHCDYGYNIRIGRGAFVNFGCVFLDVVGIDIGDGCQIGPAVQIYTADHPRDPALRRAGYESGKPVRIGQNVWIGGGAIILPGITVGDDAVIEAGSVVTRDVATGTTVVGNPARAQKREV